MIRSAAAEEFSESRLSLYFARKTQRNGINAINLRIAEAISERHPIKTIKQQGNSHRAQHYIVGGKAYTNQVV